MTTSSTHTWVTGIKGLIYTRRTVNSHGLEQSLMRRNPQYVYVFISRLNSYNTIYDM